MRAPLEIYVLALRTDGLLAPCRLFTVCSMLDFVRLDPRYPTFATDELGSFRCTVSHRRSFTNGEMYPGVNCAGYYRGGDIL